MARPSKEWDHFTHDLIALFIGVERDDENYGICWKFIRTNLRQGRCLSTRPHEYEQKYAGLAEKFVAHSQMQRAEALTSLRAQLLETWRPADELLPHHVLRLLFELSQSPTSAKYVPSVVTKSVIAQRKLTWKDIIRDEPLTGEHWQMPTFASGSDSESDYVTDEENASHAGGAIKSTFQKQFAPIPTFPQSADAEQRASAEARLIREILHKMQFWHGNRWQHTLSNAKPFDFYEAVALAPALAAAMDSAVTDAQQVSTELYITERQAVRQTIFMLLGRDCFLFKHIGGIVQPSDRASLRHLSRSALHSSLSWFARHGTAIAAVREYASVVLTQDVEPKSRVNQAFAAAIHCELMLLEKQLRVLEHEYSIAFAPAKESRSVVSLSVLQQRLAEPLGCFHVLLTLLGRVRTDDAAVFSTSILDELYRAVVDAHFTEDTAACGFLLRLFERALAPYMETLHAWVFIGELDDLNGEFFIERNRHVQHRADTYWESSYRLRCTADSVATRCPTFLYQYRRCVMTAGKTVHLARLISDGEHLVIDEGRSLMMKQYRLAEAQVSPHADVATATRSMELCASAPSVKRYPRLMQALFSTGQASNGQDAGHGTQQSAMAHANPCAFLGLSATQAPGAPWIPLEAIIARALSGLLASRREESGQRLVHVLATRCALWNSLSALHGFYYMLAGQSWHRFCDTLFSKMDAGGVWAERRLVDHLLLDAVQGDTILDERCVSAWIRTSAQLAGGVESSSVCVLEQLDFDYTVAWPLNNIILPGTRGIYRKVTNLLLQVRRARHFLQHPRYLKLRLRPNSPSASATTMALFYALRTRLIAFTNGLYNYLMTTVLHAESQRFIAAARALIDLDAIIALHERHVALVRDRCLLHEKASTILRSILSLLDATSQLHTVFDRYVETDCTSFRITDAPAFHAALVEIADTFERTRKFVESALRGMARAGGFQHVDVLAALIAN
ncbi:Spc98 family-domain-containing protein [Thamnocephalis sphaerospora]|uniref:Spindle pole body component n=1 Tax=Thamnocephalis sphaerospora TaxID=78915 RepID=A0A4P9XS69_9FUNG|nr:Spc98 family-domain-containing protein [Thamnocephalis sphaerospora]|eukprot:RKP08974.1 Spc98 family-domain-containing protein [Thamnocephalis sphaerospora]